VIFEPLDFIARLAALVSPREENRTPAEQRAAMRRAQRLGPV